MTGRWGHWEVASTEDAWCCSPGTIVPAWYGDRLNLHETIWACFANAGLAKEKREAAAAQPGR